MLDRKDLFIETARKLKIHEGIIEKDFWVCWVLETLFESPKWGDAMVFKGGTSLSKVYNCIQLFSEDIDLIIDWRRLGYTDEDLWKDRSNTQKGKFFEQEVPAVTNYFIKTTFIPDFKGELEEKLENNIGIEFNKQDAAVIITYPRSFTIGYILPEIKLEIGPLAEWVPHNKYSIAPFAAQVFPELFKKATCEVIAICAERTFWEKATILHQQAMRGFISPRYSRHYYDLSQMAISSIKENAFNRLDLLKNVVAFKMQFYHSKIAQYELAVPGTLKLLPSENLLEELSIDYKKMREMIYGDPPAFEKIIETLAQLEADINALVDSTPLILMKD